MLTELVGSVLSTEIRSYFSVIEDDSVRSELEDEVAKMIASKRLNEDGDYYRVYDIRQKCLGALLCAISERGIYAPPGSISERTCKFAVELYVQNDYRKFDEADRSLIVAVNNFNDELVMALMKYLASEMCDRFAFHENVKFSEIFAKRIRKLRTIYPDVPLEKMVNYIFVVKPSDNVRDRKKRLLIESVVLLKDNGYDFFDIVDMLRNYYQPLGKAIFAKEFNMFVHNLARLTDFGVKFTDYFSDDLPCSMERLSNLICALSNGQRPKPATLALSPAFFSECVAWANLGYPISEYVSKGYKLPQLRIIRSILHCDVDPNYFNFNCGMSAKEMQQIFDVESTAVIDRIGIGAISKKHRPRE